MRESIRRSFGELQRRIIEVVRSVSAFVCVEMRRAEL
jgi:hypothetical protein